jgi:hypothetical protein
LGWQLLDELEHDWHVDVVVGPARGPQLPVLPPLLLPLLLLVVPPLLPPLLDDVPPHSLAGTHALTCAPSAVESVVHDSPAVQPLEPEQIAAQYVSPPNCAHTPRPQLLSVRHGTQALEPPLEDPLPPPLLLLVLSEPLPPSPKAVSLVVACPEHAASAARDARAPSASRRGRVGARELRVSVSTLLRFAFAEPEHHVTVRQNRVSEDPCRNHGDRP